MIPVPQTVDCFVNSFNIPNPIMQYNTLLPYIAPKRSPLVEYGDWEQINSKAPRVAKVIHGTEWSKCHPLHELRIPLSSINAH